MENYRSPKFFGLPVEQISKLIAITDIGLTFLLIINVITALIYGTVWLNTAIAVISLCAGIGCLVCYWYAFDRNEAIFMIYPIIFQAIVLCWGLILVLAGIFCVTSGHLWPLESILGIKPAEIKTSKDIRDRNYVSPNDTSPETSRAIFWGEITVIFGLLLFSFKLISFIILKILYEYYLQFDIEDYDYYVNYSKMDKNRYGKNGYDDVDEDDDDYEDEDESETDY